MNRFIAGAVGGLLATVPMTMVMARLFRRLPPSEQYSLPPREITEVVVAGVTGNKDLGNSRLTCLSLVAHFAYGAATGALYPLVSRRARHPVLFGGGYGVAIWAASYLGWVPAAKLLRPASIHPRRRNRLMICAHLVWGACTVSITEALASSPTLKLPGFDANQNRSSRIGNGDAAEWTANCN